MQAEATSDEGGHKLSRSRVLRLSSRLYVRCLSVKRFQRLAAMRVQGPSNDADSSYGYYDGIPFNK